MVAGSSSFRGMFGDSESWSFRLLFLRMELQTPPKAGESGRDGLDFAVFPDDELLTKGAFAGAKFFAGAVCGGDGFACFFRKVSFCDLWDAVF